MKHFYTPVIASALAVSLTVGFVTPAYAVSAELEAQVDEAQAHLSELYGEAEQRNYELEQTVSDLNDTIEKLDETSDAIAQTEADLVVARQHLSEVISEDYKSGQIDLLSLVFTSGSFDDLVSRFVYANKVASYHADVVAEVNDLSTQLNEQRDTYAKAVERQKKLVTEQKRLKEETDQAIAEAQDYYDQLSDEMQAQIAAEQEAAAKAAQEEAAAAAAEAEKRAAQQAEESSEADSNADTSTTNNQTTNSETTATAPNSTTTTSSSSSNKVTTGTEAPVSSVAPASTSSAAAMVSQAYTAIGSSYRYSGYVWTGNPATSAFTCSGLVDFALGRPSNSSWPSSLYAEVQSAGGIKNSIGSLSYGDLVFTGTGGIGHVGIYVGDGCFLDSSWGGVSVRSINPSTFIGGGSIF